MKKTICILLAAFMTLAVCSGCQKTPDNPLVVEKNMENMLEKAQETEHSENNDLSLKEKTQISFEEVSFEETDGNVSIFVNAQIQVPDGTEMNIICIKPGEFTQEQITPLWDALVNDMEMFEESVQLTKQEIEQAILFHKEAISKAEDEDVRAYHEEKLNYYNALYEEAPETSTPERVDGRLDVCDDGRGSEYTGIHAVSQDGMVRFSVENPYRGNDGIMHDARLEYSRLAAGTETPTDGAPNIESITVSLNDESVPKQAEGLALSPAAAVDLINDFFEKVNLPFAASEMMLKNDKDNNTWKYTAFCTRLAGDIPSAFILGESYYKQQDGSNSYMESWNYETVTVSVDDSGIRGISWEYPVEMIEKVVDDSSLLPFSDIQNIFRKMMFVTYKFQARDIDALILDVTDIRLESLRIIEQNADERQGLLVPVWNFYGTRSRQYGDEEDTTSKMILLSVNAIDGTIIDISKGY